MQIKYLIKTHDVSFAGNEFVLGWVLNNFDIEWNRNSVLSKEKCMNTLARLSRSKAAHWRHLVLKMKLLAQASVPCVRLMMTIRAWHRTISNKLHFKLLPFRTPMTSYHGNLNIEYVFNEQIYLSCLPSHRSDIKLLLEKIRRLHNMLTIGRICKTQRSPVTAKFCMSVQFINMLLE